MKTDTTRTNTTRDYTLRLNDGELDLLTGMVERMMLDAETEADLGRADSYRRANDLMALLNKLENIEPVEGSNDA